MNKFLDIKISSLSDDNEYDDDKFNEQLWLPTKETWIDRFEYTPLYKGTVMKEFNESLAKECIHEYKERVLFTTTEKYCIKCNKFERS